MVGFPCAVSISTEIHWSRTSIFASSLMEIIDMAGWDFYFLIVLLAGSEERVFFSQER